MLSKWQGSERRRMTRSLGKATASQGKEARDQGCVLLEDHKGPDAWGPCNTDARGGEQSEARRSEEWQAPRGYGRLCSP